MSNCVKETQLLDFRTFKSVTAIVIYSSVPKCSRLLKRESLAFLGPVYMEWGTPV